MANPEPVRRDPDRRSDKRAATPVTVRIGSHDTVPSVVAGLIFAFLALAILKPWVGPTANRNLDQEPTARSTVDAGSIEPGPGSGAPTAGSDRPEPSSSAWFHCGEQPGWRVYTREIVADRIVRAWREVEPATAVSDPLDSAIPVIQIGPIIDAVGFCGPTFGSEQAPDDAAIGAWRIRQTTPPVFTPVPLESVIPDLPTSLGGLYRPTTHRVHATVLGASRWTSGRYVLSIQAPGWERWWAVEIPRSDPP